MNCTSARLKAVIGVAIGNLLIFVYLGVYATIVMLNEGTSQSLKLCVIMWILAATVGGLTVWFIRGLPVTSTGFSNRAAVSEEQVDHTVITVYAPVELPSTTPPALSMPALSMSAALPALTMSARGNA